jgi:uncharacterized membrane protein HdeD (DUF308 family)
MITLRINWWAFVIRGILAVLFGLLVWLFPGMALLTLIYLFGIYALVEGLFNLFSAFGRPHTSTQPWWALLLEGFISIAAGLCAFVLPGITALALLYLIAAWALITGILKLVAAVRLRRHMTGEWVLALAGILSIAFAILLVLAPGAGALAVVLWIGTFAILFGALLIFLGFRLLQWSHFAQRQPPITPFPA